MPQLICYSTATVSTFILAEIQKKPRKSWIEFYVDDFRHIDIALLPYPASAIIKEVIRWRPIVPLVTSILVGGVPHAVDEDTFYNEYFIPAGSVILPNIWAMLHDEKEYPDPESFKPERYINDDELENGPRNPADIIFGFGRGSQVCPSHIERLAGTMNIFV